MHRQSFLRVVTLLASVVGATPLLSSGQEVAGNRALQYEWLSNAPRQIESTAADLISYRSFNLDLDGDGAIDSLYFKRETATTTICFGGANPECRSYPTEAVDVVPQTLGDVSQGVVVVGKDDATVCTLAKDRSSLRCLGELDKSQAQLAPGQVMLLRSAAQSTNCIVTATGALRCTASRKFLQGDQVLGEFSRGNGPQLVRLSPTASESCGAFENAPCRREASLDNIDGTRGIAVARLAPDGPVALIALGSASVSICLRSAVGDSPLACESEALVAGSEGLTGWVTARITGGKRAEGTGFISRANPELALATTTAVKVAYANLSARLGYDDLPTPKIYYYDGDTPPSYDLIPNDFDFDWVWPGSTDQDYWSDIVDLWYWDRTAPKPAHTACVALCGNERSDSYYQCGFWGAAAAVSCGGVGALLTVTITGPASPAFVAGVATASGGACGGLAVSVCNNAADSSRINCIAKCP